MKEGKPQDNESVAACLKDPAFFEYFTKGAPCYLTDNVCRSKRLCNGTKGRYHSLILGDERKRYFDLVIAKAVAGDVITLPQCPLAINILIEDSKVVSNSVVNWDNLSLEEDSLVIPIRPGTQNSPTKPIPIHNASILCHASRVVIKPNFSLQPGFAITVDKGQGQTLDRVIVALSKRELALTDFKFSCLYVALSRVRERQFSMESIEI